MFDLEAVKKEYEKIKNQIEQNRQIISDLEEDENIKKYIDIKNKIDKLEDNFITISLEYQVKQMDECNHIYVKTCVDNFFDYHRTDKTEHYYCIKCGLDTLLASKEQHKDPHYARIVKIFKKTRYKAIHLSEYECHPALAKKIYEGILKVHPDISDEDLIKYFKIAIHNIKTNNEEDHIKHLGLTKNYSDKWSY